MKQFKLKEIFEISRGRVINQKYINENKGIYPVYSSKTFNNGIFGNINTYDYDGEFLTWTTDGVYAGNVFYRNGKFNCTNVCGILKLKNELKNELNIKFLYFLLRNKIRKHIIIGATRNRIMSNVIENIKINVISFKEQQKIIDIIEPIEKQIKIINKILYFFEQTTKLNILINKKETKIKEIIKSYNLGFAYKKNNFKDNGYFKIAKIKNISDNENFKYTNILKKNKIEIGDVLTGLSGTIGTSNINILKNIVSNQRLLVLNSNFGLKIQELIKIKKKFIISNSNISVQRNISHNNILNLKININKNDKLFNDLYIYFLKIKNNLKNNLKKIINILIK